MSVWAQIAAARMGQDIQKSIAEALKRKMQAEREQQAMLERMRLQAELQRQQQELAAKEAWRRMLAESTLRAAYEAEASGMAPPGASAEVAKLLEGGDLTGALQRAYGVLGQASSKQWLEKKRNDFVNLLTQYGVPEDVRQKAIAAFDQGDVEGAMMLVANAVSGARYEEFLQRMKELGLRVKESEVRLKYLEPMLATQLEESKLALERAKVLLKRDASLAELAPVAEFLKMAKEHPEWAESAVATFAAQHGIDPEALKREVLYYKWVRDVTKENTELEKRLNEERLKLTEIERKIREIGLKYADQKELLGLREQAAKVKAAELDIEIKALEKAIKEGELEEYKESAAFRLAEKIGQLAKLSPDVAQSFIEKNKDKLIKAGIDPDAFKPTLDLMKRVREYQDPKRSFALQVYQGWLDKPPQPTEWNRVIEETRNLLLESGLSEDEANLLIEQMKAAWAGALSATEIEKLRLQAESMKYSANQLDNVRKLLNDARQSLSAEAESVRKEIDGRLKKMQAEGCYSTDVYGRLVLNMYDEKCREAAKRAGEEMERLVSKYNTIQLNLRQIAVRQMELGGLKPATPEDVNQNDPKALLVEWMNSLTEPVEEAEVYRKVQELGLPLAYAERAIEQLKKANLIKPFEAKPRMPSKQTIEETLPKVREGLENLR